jgi:hypothetical protein
VVADEVVELADIRANGFAGQALRGWELGRFNLVNWFLRGHLSISCDE